MLLVFEIFILGQLYFYSAARNRIECDAEAVIRSILYNNKNNNNHVNVQKQTIGRVEINKKK